jgi:hypothetical protein
MLIILFWKTKLIDFDNLKIKSYFTVHFKSLRLMRYSYRENSQPCGSHPLGNLTVLFFMKISAQSFDFWGTYGQNFILAKKLQTLI